MDPIIHIVTTVATIIFIGAVLYSLTSALRKKRRKAKYEKDLVTKVHVKVDNLHQ